MIVIIEVGLDVDIVEVAVAMMTTVESSIPSVVELEDSEKKEVEVEVGSALIVDARWEI